MGYLPEPYLEEIKRKIPPQLADGGRVNTITSVLNGGKTDSSGDESSRANSLKVEARRAGGKNECW